MPVLVLDELDSGMGARLGSSVGAMLVRMTAGARPPTSQVIAVTHLPQVRQNSSAPRLRPGAGYSHTSSMSPPCAVGASTTLGS